MVKDKPGGYSFPPELEATDADQISIEVAQPKLNLSILKTLLSKTVMVGVLDIADE
jgi:5-methyltetrahydropteroyltriglutamate--homocysteine methyltransferase